MIYKKPELLNKFRNYYNKYDIQIEEANLFGIRFEEDQKKDIWNDILGIWTQHNVYCWTGTTDPGKHATETSSIGVAHLCYGYHKDIWQKGIHGSNNPNFAHPALIQTGNKICIWRDENKNYENDEGRYIEGYFGINWHRASKIHDVPTIGNYSAGCQVTLNSQDFEFGLNLIFNTNKFKENNNCKFSYALFNHKELGL